MNDAIFEIIKDICLFIISIMIFIFATLVSLYNKSFIYGIPWLFIGGWFIMILSDKYNWWIYGLRWFYD